jgi:uncharacterized protein (DUF488 family)
VWPTVTGTWNDRTMNSNNGVRRVWTIGHSRHELVAFLELLKDNEISALVDVRTIPMSRMAPQFNEGSLKKALTETAITYISMGKELGGRPSEDFMYDSEGRVFYNKLAESEIFKTGVERLLKGSDKFNIVIMCSEGKPDGCHRHLLIGRVLHEMGIEVVNILVDGSLKNYKQLSPEESQMPLIDLGEEEPWKSVLPVRQESQQSDSSYD